jgi:hypothetical protein
MAAQHSFTTLWDVAGAAVGLDAGWVLSFVAVHPERVRPVRLIRAWLAGLSRMRRTVAAPARRDAFSTMCRVLASAAGLGAGSFLYALWILGTSALGFFFALGGLLLVSGLAVLGGVVLFLE